MTKHMPFMEQFMTKPVSNLPHDQENLQSYCAGGFHPVCLGDKFKDRRYEVVHKLGWGGSSTVWLAKDAIDEKWVALKICKANSTSSQRELSMLQWLQDNRVSQFAVTLYDDFIHDGVNGSHLCIVTEFLGPSLNTVVEDYHRGGERLDSEDILRLIRQILQATADFHNAGLAHGDLSGDNIVFTTSSLSSLSKEQLFDIVGKPETADLFTADGSPPGPRLPKHLVQKIEWENWIDEDEEDIRLVDLGESFLFNCPPSKLAQPTTLRVPETFFTRKFDHKVDMWRLGCIIYAILFASYPFMCLRDDDVLIAQMIGFVENLPCEWEEAWDQMQNPAHRLVPTHQVSAEFESKLVKKFGALRQDPDLVQLLTIVQGLMKFRPVERISASDALKLLQN